MKAPAINKILTISKKEPKLTQRQKRYTLFPNKCPNAGTQCNNMHLRHKITGCIVNAFCSTTQPFSPAEVHPPPDRKIMPQRGKVLHFIF